MKLIGILLLSICLHFTVTGYAEKINIKEENAPLTAVFKKLQEQTNYTFLYTKEAISKANKVNIELVNASLNEALQKIFLTQPFNYIIFNQMVIIKEKAVVVTEVNDSEPVISQQQQNYSISGTVTDEKGAPVVGASVFIADSKNVKPTDIEGKFNFDNIQPGSYAVVIKMMGFDVVNQEVTIKNRSVKIIATLHESMTVLHTVTISGHVQSKLERSRYLDLFMTNFIGQTVNAQHCKILNPEVLNFTYNRKDWILTATADEFLIIENKGLGYKIKYLLTEFKLDEKSNTCTNSGYPYFEDLKGDEAQQKKWEENRRVAYLSSPRNFFRALVNNTLKQEGFTVYIATNLMKPTNDMKINSDLVYLGYNMSGNFGLVNRPAKFIQKNMLSIIELPYTNSLFITGDEKFKTIANTPKVVVNKRISDLAIKGDTIGRDTITLKSMIVIYTGEDESPLFEKTGIPINNESLPFLKLTKAELKHRQISQLLPLADTATVNKNGTITPQKGFKHSNYWGWLRIADLVPIEYFVEFSEKKK